MVILITTIISAILYRIGGHGKPFRTWMRDWTIPLIVLAILFFIYNLRPHWWVWVISYPLMAGALTTYLDKIFRADNYYAHGFLIGLGVLPFAVVGVISWSTVIFRAVVLGMSMGLWCAFFDKRQTKYKDWIEECGRGAFIILTLIMFIV